MAGPRQAKTPPNGGVNAMWAFTIGSRPSHVPSSIRATVRLHSGRYPQEEAVQSFRAEEAAHRTGIQPDGSDAVQDTAGRISAWAFPMAGDVHFHLPLDTEECWQRVHSPHLVALVQAGIKFHDGKPRILPDLPIDSLVSLPVHAAPDPMIHSLWRYIAAMLQ